jgi:hypothetical protein
MTDLILMVDEDGETRPVHAQLDGLSLDDALTRVQRALNNSKTFVPVGDNVVNSMKVSSVIAASEVSE